MNKRENKQADLLANAIVSKRKMYKCCLYILMILND